MYKHFLLSHKYTGVPVDELMTMLPALKNVLLGFTDNVFCSMEHEQRFIEQQRPVEKIYQRCLEQQATCDAVVGFLHYDTPSRGMEQELVLAKERAQPYFLLKRRFDIDPDFLDLYTTAATRILEYSSFEELLVLLEKEGNAFFTPGVLSHRV